MKGCEYFMNKEMIDRFIYEFNLASTRDNNVDIDYKNSISLYNFVDSFNKLYLKFREDYALLPILGIDGDINLGWYDGVNGSKYERLTLFVGKEKIIYIDRINDVYECYIVNVMSDNDEDFKYEKLNVDTEVIKKYLDFGSKYDVLITGYNQLKNKQIFGNGYTLMFTKINGGLLNEFNTFEISFGNVSMNYEDYINLVFILGDNLELDYDNSIVKLGGTLYEDKSMFIDVAVKGIYINNKYNLFIDENKNRDKIRKMLPNS